MRHLVGGLGLVRAHWGLVTVLAVFALPLSAATAPLGVGLYFGARALRKLLRTLLADAGVTSLADPEDSRGAKPSAWDGPLATAAALAIGGLGGAMVLVIQRLAGHALLEPARPAAMGLAAVLCAAAVGGALAPLMFAPLFAAAGTRGALRPFSRSFELAARLGAARAAGLGASAAGLGALLGGLTVGLGALLGDGDAGLLIALPLAAGLGMPLPFAALAHAFAEHAPTLSASEASARPAAKRVRALWGLLAPALVALGAAAAIAAVTPVPMQETERPPELSRGFHGFGLQHGEQTRRLPGTTVTVRTAARGLVVEADDGGGAGEVPASFATDPGALYVRELADGAFAVAVTDGRLWASTALDVNGVRLDDDLGRRVFGRLGPAGLGALGGGMLLLLVLSFTFGTSVGQARQLEVPELKERGGRGRLGALGGVLRVGEGGRAKYIPGGLVSSAGLVPEGEVWIEADAGAFRLRLTEPVRVLAGEAASWEGQHVVVVSRFATLSPTGLRQAAVPFPEDGALVLGRHEDASEALVSRAVRRASWLALPTLGLLGAAAFQLFWAL